MTLVRWLGDLLDRLLSIPRMNLLTPDFRAEIMIVIEKDYDARLYCTKLDQDTGREGVGRIVQKVIALAVDLGTQYGVTVNGVIGTAECPQCHAKLGGN